MATVNQSQPQSNLLEWKHGLLECVENCDDCVLAHFCPCCYASCAAQATQSGACCIFLNCLCYPFCLCCLRTKVRHEKSIEGNPCKDCIAITCCPPCSAIQIKRQYD